jgi:thiosulfate/3-mercaptopyruvate sulfurtransferase
VTRRERRVGATDWQLDRRLKISDISENEMAWSCVYIVMRYSGRRWSERVIGEGAMKSRIVVALGVGLLAMAGAVMAGAEPQGCGGHGTQQSMVVSSAWLAEHLKDPNLVIFAVGDQSEYDQGHIPGAQFLDYMATHEMTSAEGLTLELPPMAQLADVFGKLGVSNDSEIVLYMTGKGISQTTRVWWTLDAMGLGAHAAILDGGFSAWKTEGRPVTTDRPNVTPAKLTPCAATDVKAELADVKASVRQPGVDIVDARANSVYVGKDTYRDIRAGHIPGALNIPYLSLFDDSGKLKPADQLAAMFGDAGVKHGDKMITYCFIGQQASALYFVARYLGYDVRLFDGSMEDWGRHKDLPVETGEGHK